MDLILHIYIYQFWREPIRAPKSKVRAIISAKVNCNDSVNVHRKKSNKRRDKLNSSIESIKKNICFEKCIQIWSRTNKNQTNKQNKQKQRKNKNKRTAEIKLAS